MHTLRLGCQLFVNPVSVQNIMAAVVIIVW